MYNEGTIIIEEYARLQGAISALRLLMVEDNARGIGREILLSESELNTVLMLAGEEPVVSEKAEIKES